MRRRELSALVSAGITAQREGRIEQARTCAEALIHALRVARAERQQDAGGTRAADLDAIRWALDTIGNSASPTPN